MELLQNADLISKGLSSIAAVMAIVGIGTWRRDFVGKRRIELAEETLERFYQAADAVRHMRSPMAFTEESSDVLARDDESKARFNARVTVAPLFKRHAQHAELFAAIRATRYKYMARFGPGTDKPFQDLHRLVNEIMVAAGMYAAAAGQLYDNDDGPHAQRIREQQREREEKFWDMGADDAINQRLDAIIANVENQCRPIIERQLSASGIGTWWPFSMLKSLGSRLK